MHIRGKGGANASRHAGQHGGVSLGTSAGSCARGEVRQQAGSKGADPALARLLTSLDLGRFLPQFVDEEMDMEAFGASCTWHHTCARARWDHWWLATCAGMLTDEDLQEMSIAKGPRLKLLQAINHVRT